MSERARRRSLGGAGRWIFIVAPLVIVAALFANSYLYFARVIAAKDWTGQGFAKPAAIALATAYDGLKVMVNSLRVSLDTAPVPATSELPAVQLRIADGSLEAMTADLPTSAKARYFKARLLYPDGRWRAIRYRLRGRGHWHWLKEKPSLRLKLKRSAPLELQRHINLVNPEDRPMVANPLGEELARRLGLLTHRTEFVRLFINGAYRGVYHRTTREDESLLRLRKRLPGPIYEAYSLAPRWRAADYLKKGETDVLKGFDPLAPMIEAIYAPLGPDRYAKLWRHLDFEKYARFAALMSLVAGTHADAFHNHLYYFDPSRGLIEPWITDINGHGMLLHPSGTERFRGPQEPDHQVPLNELITPLRDAALRDPRLLHRRNQVLYEALRGSGSVAAQKEVLEGWFRRMDADVRADRHKGALDRDYLEPYRLPYANAQYAAAKRTLYAWIERRNAFLLAELARTAVSVTTGPPDAAGRVRVLVTVTGNAAVRFDAPAAGTVTADRDLDGTPDASVSAPLVLHPGLDEDTGPLRPSLRVFRRVPGHALVAGSQHYLLEMPAALAGKLAGAFRNAVTGAAVAPVIAAGRPAATYNQVSVHPWRFAAPATEPVVLGPGPVRLTADLNIGPRQRLQVRPGTTIALAPGVSIVAAGPVRMEGTASRPVILRRLDPARAWGVLAIQGPASSGSVIRHAVVHGGSAARRGGVAYSGMVSVHHSPDFRLEDSQLAGNVLSDDTLHLVNATFEMRRVLVRNCFADCIDLDFADGDADGLYVNHAGNDGVDFMGSRVTLKNVFIHAVGDKGLSVGEASEIEVAAARIADAATGVAVKDASRAALEDLALDGNDVALDLFAKNWRYGGPGAVEVTGGKFTNNAVDLRTQAGGQAVFVGPVPAKVTGDGTVEERAGPGA